MSIWNKLLIGFIFFASVAFFYLAMRTLKTHQYWRVLAQGFEKKIGTLENENRELVEGKREGEHFEPGIEQMRPELDKLIDRRGRVWYNCDPKPNPETGQVAVTTDLPDPHGIGDKTVLYVFEEAEVDQSNPAQSGQYVGEFRVTAVAEKQVQLEPSMKIKPGSREFKRLVAGKGPWTLYEIMPLDSYDPFAELDEAELKKLLPEACLIEYLKHGIKATPDKLEEWGVKGKLVDENGKEVQGDVEGTYLRPLRDYKVLFKAYHLQKTKLLDLFESTTRDKQYVDDAVADAKRQQQFREQEKARLQAELAQRRRERDAAADHRKNLEAKLAALQASIGQLIAGNKATAAQIAKIQLEAARQIDARTRRMAQAEPGASN